MRPRGELPRRSAQLEHNQCHGPFNFFPSPLCSAQVSIYLPVVFMGVWCRIGHLKAGGGGFILLTMSLQRRIRHRASRRRLVREGLFFYLLSFAFIFLDLHLVGIKHYYPSFHRVYLPVNPAAHQAALWAFLGPILWVLQEYLLRGTDLWESFWGLDQDVRRLVVAGAAVVVAATFVAWRWMPVSPLFTTKG